MSRTRSTYRHGDLRQALIETGVELAREGGPAAVVLREATRRAGVSPNAAYRHFSDRAELVDAVSSAAQARVAAAIDLEWQAIPAGLPPADTARARLRAVGRGYLRFARDEPGLFRAAFSVPADMRDAFSADKAGPGGKSPFELLATALDDMVDAGVLPPERRPAAEILAWSAVHGLAMLVLEGPLRDLDAETAAAVGQRLIEMVQKGL